MHYLARHQPPVRFRFAAMAGLGAGLTILVLAGLSQHHVAGTSWLMAPFGASCVLVFSAPTSPLSQPANVIFGHLFATFCGLAVHALWPDAGLMLGGALAVGLAVAGMALLRITHPPAGADPLIVLATSPGWGFLGTPVLLGSLALVLIAAMWHRVATNDWPMAKSG